MEEKENVIIKLSFQFALDIIKYCETLEVDKRYVIANQLLKSGTSLELTYEKLKMQRAKLILYISLKLQQKKLKKQSIG